MNTTAYSFIMAVLWCNVFIALIAILRRRTSFILHFSIMPLLVLLLVCVSRLLFVFELPFTIEIPSTRIYPMLLKGFTNPLISILNQDICLLHILISIWAIGSVYLIQKYVCASIKLSKGVKALVGTQNPEIIHCMNEIVRASKKNTTVKVLQSKDITVPMVTGFFNPVIYLPDIPFSKNEVKNILLHEWTHFLHHDAFIKSFLYFITAIFWWNPFSHVLKKNVAHILEIQCDLQITSPMSTAARTAYLRSILKVIKFRAKKNQVQDYGKLLHASALISTSNENLIEQRFSLVLDYNPNKEFHPALLLFYGGLFILLLTSHIFILQPSGHPTVEAGYEESFTITPQNAYLTENEDGTYSLYIDGEYKGMVPQIDFDPLSSLTIK